MSNSTSSNSSVDVSNSKYWQGDDLTQEFKNFMSTLPQDQGWSFSNLSKYQGFWYPTRHLQGVITCQTHFQAQEDDILIITPPKCGTTWLKALLFAVVNRAIMAPNRHDHPLITCNPHDLVPFLEMDVYSDHPLLDLSNFHSPRVLSTHIPLRSLPRSVKEPGCKIVYLCRDPKDAFVSLWHFCHNLRPEGKGAQTLEEAYEKFCKGVNIFGPFWDHVLDYWNYSLEMPHKVLFLKFEDLKKQPKSRLIKLANFCDCPFTLEEENEGTIEHIIELCSFDNLSKLEVNNVGKLSSGLDNKVFFRKGDVGDWVNYMTPQMVEQFDRISQQKLGPSGLEF